MPRTPNPDGPGKGNRTGNRYKGGTPRRTVVIDKDLARQLRQIDPDIRIDNLVHALLVQWMIDNATPPERGATTPMGRMRERRPC